MTKNKLDGYLFFILIILAITTMSIQNGTNRSSLVGCSLHNGTGGVSSSAKLGSEDTSMGCSINPIANFSVPTANVG